MRTAHFVLPVLAIMSGCGDDPNQANGDDNSTGGASTEGTGGAALQTGGAPATGGSDVSGGSPSDGGSSSGGTGGDETGTGGEPSLEDYASELHELLLHDTCTAPYPSQPDTCLHEQLVEQVTTFGGDPGSTYAITLRVRGLFEPTTIDGGERPLLPDHPYFVVGGTAQTPDWARWHIVVSEPAQTYYLNHYPSVSHRIENEDFEATITAAGGSEIVVRMIDGNDRQIDNKHSDHQEIIEGVTDGVVEGQLVRLDVVSVELLEN